MSFCVAWSAVGLALGVLHMDEGLVMGFWEATEGNPTTTPLLNKADTRTELKPPLRGRETPHCSAFSCALQFKPG